MVWLATIAAHRSALIGHSASQSRGQQRVNFDDVHKLRMGGYTFLNWHVTVTSYPSWKKKICFQQILFKKGQRNFIVEPPERVTAKES